MKAIRWTFFAALLLGVSGVIAQSKEGDVVVNVPFPFIVANRPMPPGRYNIAPAMESVLRISDSHNPHNQVHVPVHSVQGGGKGGARVVFHCYAGACFLIEMWTGNSQIGKQFYESNAEREIISRRSQGIRANEVAVLQPER